MMFCCTNVFSGKMINFAFNRINWSVCEQILTVHCLPSKGLSLVGWILGALFCVNMMIFLTRPKESGVVNISHYTRLSTRREHTQWTILFSFSLSICLSLTFSPSFSFFVTLYSQFLRLLFCWPNLAKNIVLIKLVGHRSEKLIEKSFTGML